eukprot:gb/GEZJ01003311.1/.p2 GENE.gb/GEZJ01003311.1/~~gb/GEZJ01003311.1/.p2  ORF type:complete len:149 (-),score=22.19 gb/GEZJ01003311.1/:1920-2366(-)
MKTFIPTTKAATAQETIQIFETPLFSKHGILHTLVSDKDPKASSRFRTSLMEVFNIRYNISTADHHQMDGQSENAIQSLSAMFRTYIQQSPFSSDSVLPALEFEVNSHRHTSTRLSPFEIAFGYNPHTYVTRPLKHFQTKSEAAIDYI